MRARKIRRITLERGPCFGPCPVYRVTVNSEGKVEWFGEAFVASLGPDTWEIPLDSVAALEDALARTDFEKLGDKCTDYSVTDMSSVRISVVFDDGTTKTIEDYHGDFSVPRELTLLEHRIDRILRTPERIREDGGLR